MNSRVLATASRYLLSVLLVLAVFLLVRGHNAPGGGFSGGLVAGAAFTLHAYAVSLERAKRALIAEPRSLLAAGLLVLLVALLLPAVQGVAPLTGLWAEVQLPGGTPLALGSPLLFDVGVFVTVLGVVTTITFAWEEQP